MNKERVSEIERKVIYKHLDNLEHDLEGCADSKIAFHVGRTIGMMQRDLVEELNKEVKE